MRGNLDTDMNIDTDINLEKISEGKSRDLGVVSTSQGKAKLPARH